MSNWYTEDHYSGNFRSSQDTSLPGSLVGMNTTVFFPLFHEGSLAPFGLYASAMTNGRSPRCSYQLRTTHCKYFQPYSPKLLFGMRPRFLRVLCSRACRSIFLDVSSLRSMISDSASILELCACVIIPPAVTWKIDVLLAYLDRGRHFLPDSRGQYYHAHQWPQSSR